ncbi:MAG TPA: DOMON domain-containing protein [Gemmatimonadales bacterium]|nr:DOMON domain-containing protein [Gemmatimonadales bacterium]
MKNADRVPALALAGGAVLAVLLAFTLHLPQRLVSAAGTSSVHRLDGRVTSGEYRFRWTDDASKLVFQWSIVGDRLIGAVTSPDTGWVAVGFGGEGPLMYGADIVIGYVDAHGAHVEDHYANTPTSHVADTALGGHDDILGSAGLRTAAGTTIEFERPLAAHDSTDRPIVAGQMHVIMASSESPDLMAYHVEGHKAVALLDMFNGPPAAAGAGALLPDHLTDVQIMIAAWMAILLIIGLHGVASSWAEGRTAEPAAHEDERTAVAVALTVVMMVLELAALGSFAVGVVLAWPVWVLGLALAVGMLALAGVVVLYSRAFVRWETTRAERDDGIPW